MASLTLNEHSFEIAPGTSIKMELTQCPGDWAEISKLAQSLNSLVSTLRFSRCHAAIDMVDNDDGRIDLVLHILG